MEEAEDRAMEKPISSAINATAPGLEDQPMQAARMRDEPSGRPLPPNEARRPQATCGSDPAQGGEPRQAGAMTMLTDALAYHIEDAWKRYQQSGAPLPSNPATPPPAAPGTLSASRGTQP